MDVQSLHAGNATGPGMGLPQMYFLLYTKHCQYRLTVCRGRTATLELHVMKFGSARE